MLRIGGGIRPAVIVAVILSLTLSQLVISLSHGSTIPPVAAGLMEHVHGPAASPSDIAATHEAADHEHQPSAFVFETTAILKSLPQRWHRLPFSSLLREGISREGPKRPPRPV